MQVQELRELDAEELSGRLKGARRELFELRFKLAVGQLDNPQQIKIVRHEIARILTIVHERLLDQQVDEAYADAEPVATLPVVEAPAEEAASEPEAQADTPDEVEAPAAAEDASETDVEVEDESHDEREDDTGDQVEDDAEDQIDDEETSPEEEKK